MKTLHIKLSKLLFLIMFTFLGSSCHLLYLPNQINAPVLTEKGDFSGSISTGLSNFNFQTAYSPAQNVGIMLNYAGGKTSSFENSTKTNIYNFLEGGLGYYLPLTSNILFDIYTGFGRGEAYTYDESFDTPTSVNGKYSRLFIQPSITISSRDAFDANFAVRPVLIFMNKTTNYNTISHSTTLFFEPVITLKYGWKYIKIINQLGLSIPGTTIDYGMNPFILSVGLNFQLKSKWRTRM
ncbi:MAG: hypothetical protein GZ091_12800 [Paludibacter sp.]|nr:hypothetical protein [Paludibacter sp.]